MLSRLKPALPQPWLKLLSGLMWSGVGIMLGRLAWGWLRPLEMSLAVLLGGVLPGYPYLTGSVAGSADRVYCRCGAVGFRYRSSGARVSNVKP